MTTFTMQDLAPTQVNPTKPTKEEWVNYIPPTPEPTPETPDVATIINTICTQLQLLSTVISKGAGEGNSHKGEAVGTDVPSLQECVSTTLQQAEWLEEKIKERVEELVDDMDFSYAVNNEVEDWFCNSFSLDDHVDIAAEVESKLEDIVERMVEDKLQEVVEEKLRDASISISF